MVETEGLIKRIERLERDNVRLRLGVLVLLLIVGWVLVVGQVSVPETITAHRFVVLDDAGKERVWLVGADGGPALIFKGLDGRETLLLSSTIDGSYLAFYHKDGKPQIALATNLLGSQFNMFSNEDGPEANLSVFTQGASMRFNGKDGVESLRLP